MATSLRKACHACTTAKRRCVPQLPRCPRCLDKGLECHYDLEPVTNTSETKVHHQVTSKDRDPPSASAVPAHLFSSIAAAQRHSMSVRKPFGFDSQDFPPCLMANSETVAMVVEQLKRIPLLIFSDKTSPFAHAWILSMAGTTSSIHKHNGSQIPNIELIDKERRRLLALDVDALPYTQFLGEFHKLIAAMLSSFFQCAPNATTDQLPNEALISLFWSWGEIFKKTLPEDLSTDLSPWQAWVIAESSRRTIIALWWVSGLIEMLRTGYCSYRPFVESLPFDARTGLWEADTAEAWKAALDSHGGDQSDLVSWREFIESGGPHARPRLDGMLQRLLLAAYFGKDTQSEPN